VAHILLSETYKSNNFSGVLIVCTFHKQFACFTSAKLFFYSQTKPVTPLKVAATLMVSANKTDRENNKNADKTD
jgi:hypothetical protein